MNKELGKRIKYYRLLKEISRERLVEKLGISIHTLAKYEQGQREPNIETLNKIADTLDVPVTKLLGIKKDNTPYMIPGLYALEKDNKSIEDIINIDFKSHKEEYMKTADKYSLKFISNLIFEKPYDKKLSDIKKKLDTGETLSDEDRKIIDDNAARKKIEKDFKLTEDISLMDYEKESYILFKKLLISLGYTDETAKPYLFKKIKAQIDLEISMQKE